MDVYHYVNLVLSEMVTKIDNGRKIWRKLGNMHSVGLVWWMHLWLKQN